MQTRYSVIIPTLNEEKFLPKLLASLAGQTQKNFEVIVVDGRSKDKTVALARSWARQLPRLSIIKAPQASLPLQRNLGERNAAGSWLVFVDADSILMPYFISRIEEFIRTKKARVFTTWTQPDSDNGNDAILSLLANMFYEATLLLHRPIAPGPLTVIDRSLFEEVGGYDETHAFHEDVELGLRLARRGVTVSLLRETLYIWSMRRIRKEGKMKLFRQMVIAAIPVLFLKKPLKSMSDYIMGGQLYTQKKRVKRSAVKRYEMKLKHLARELFS